MIRNVLKCKLFKFTEASGFVTLLIVNLRGALRPRKQAITSKGTMADTRNHIYIYDESRHKIIVIDGETGEEVRREDDRVTSLLNHLSENGERGKLRKFSVWCAHRANKKIKPIQAKMFELAEKAISENAEIDELKGLYDETEGTAIATDSVGLQHGSSSAPAFLASRECVNPDPLEGALQAARYHRLWAELKQREEDENTYLDEIDIDASGGITQRTEQAQIDYLLDLMSQLPSGR